MADCRRGALRASVPNGAGKLCLTDSRTVTRKILVYDKNITENADFGNYSAVVIQYQYFYHCFNCIPLLKS